jgi:hypothetical protein
MRLRPVLRVLTAALLCLPAMLQAQVNPKFADLTDAIDEARTVLATDRKSVIMQGLTLTPEQSAKFWPLYDEYMTKMRKVSDRRVKVITDFAANYDNLTDKTAEGLVKEGLKYNQELNDLRKSYLGKFHKVLPWTEVARFYQIENRLDVITSFALAEQIPLVPSAPTSAPLAKPAN